MKDKILKILEEEGLNMDDGFSCLTCGTGFRTYRERISDGLDFLAEQGMLSPENNDLVYEIFDEEES